MMITGALLAESASVRDNKLNVSGGVVDRVNIPNSGIVSLTLVVLTQSDVLDEAPVIELVISTPTRENKKVLIDVPESSLGGRVGFVIAPLRIAVPVEGTYTLSLSAHRGAASLPLTVVR